MHSDFQIGHPSAWKYHISNYDEYHDNDDDDFDISKCKSKKGPVVNVKKPKKNRCTCHNILI